MNNDAQEADPTPTFTTEETPLDPAFAESLTRLRALADGRTVPTGILLTSPFTYATFAEYDGDVVLRPISQRRWEQHYHDLQRSAVSDAPASAALPSTAALLDRAKEMSDQGITPIVVANVLYHAPTRRFVGDLKDAKRDGRAIPAPTDLSGVLDERRAFIASALLPHVYDTFTLLPAVHRGLQLKLVLERSSYVTNDAAGTPAIEIDFADGMGPRALDFDQVIEVHYATEGEKQIRLTAAFPERTLRAVFLLHVRAAAAVPLPEFTWPITSKLGSATGTAWVYLGMSAGVKHTKLVRPVMVADGFPGHTREYLYDHLNQQQLLSTILQSGYDVVILTYGDGKDYVQHNAIVAVACIEMMIANRSGIAPLVVGGASMGGLIVRWALLYMEKNGPAHQTRMFLSFDAPQQGAIIPPSDQFFVRALADAGSHRAEELGKLLSSPAARQMLYYSVPSAPYNGTMLDQSHMDLYQELKEMGDYPRRPRTVAIADGSGNGQHVIPDGALTLHLSDNVCVSGSTWALTTTRGETRIAKFGTPFTEQRCRVSGTTNYDGAPGGQIDANLALAQALGDAGYTGELFYENSCFIPTISSLDIETATPYMPIPPEGAPSKFDAYFVSAVNHPHVEITLEIKAFLLREVTGRYEPPPLQMVIADTNGQLHAAAGACLSEWSGPSDPLLGGFQATVPPALAARGDNLYLAIPNADGTVDIAASADGVSWAYLATQILDGLEISAPPAMAAMRGTLYLLLPGLAKHDKLLYAASSTDGINWQLLSNRPILPTPALDLAPALAVMDGVLYLAWGTNQQVSVMSSTNGVNWKTLTPQVLDYKAAAAPVLAAMGGTLYLGVPGLDGHLYIATSTDAGVNWRTNGAIQPQPGWILNISPALTSFNGTLYLAWPGESPRYLYVAASTDGLNWTSHPRLFGDWQIPFSPTLTTFVPTD